MTLYDPDGNAIVAPPTPTKPHVLTDPMPVPGAMAGALLVALSDGMSLVWPLLGGDQGEFAFQVFDFGDGPELVALARSRRKYSNTQTGEPHLAAVTHANAPGWLADFYREGGISMEGAPGLPDDGLMLANLPDLMPETVPDVD